MTAAERVEINRLIDGAGLNRVNVRLTILAFFVMLVDGYDISALAFATSCSALKAETSWLIAT